MVCLLSVIAKNWQSFSAVNENAPKVPFWLISAPSTKTKTNFGRLYTWSQYRQYRGRYMSKARPMTLTYSESPNADTNLLLMVCSRNFVGRYYGLSICHCLHAILKFRHSFQVKGRDWPRKPDSDLLYQWRVMMFRFSRTVFISCFNSLSTVHFDLEFTHRIWEW